MSNPTPAQCPTAPVSLVKPVSLAKAYGPVLRRGTAVEVARRYAPASAPRDRADVIQTRTDGTVVVRFVPRYGPAGGVGYRHWHVVPMADVRRYR